MAITQVKPYRGIGYSEFTVTTTGNIDDLDFSGADRIRMNNASLSTIRGLKAGTAGQRVTISSIGAGQVDFAHQNANSVAANRLINFVTGGVTSITAGIGVATFQYDDTTDRWQLVSHEQGSPVDVAYNAGNFTRSTGTWTVDSADQETFQYMLIGRVMMMIFRISNTDVSGAASDLRITIPGGFAATKLVPATCYTVDNGGSREVGLVFSDVGITFVECRRPLGANWTATSADNTQVWGTIFFGVT